MNYTKDGKPFWNQMCMAPVHDESGISCYLSIHTNVTGEVLAYRSQQFSPFQTKAAGKLFVYCSHISRIIQEEYEDLFSYLAWINLG